MFEVLEKAGVTQGEFAELVGVSRVTVSIWICKTGKPSARFEAKVKRYLKCLSVAVKLGLLPGNLPSPGRGSGPARKQEIHRAINEVIERSKASRAPAT